MGLCLTNKLDRLNYECARTVIRRVGEPSTKLLSEADKFKSKRVADRFNSEPVGFKCPQDFLDAKALQALYLKSVIHKGLSTNVKEIDDEIEFVNGSEKRISKNSGLIEGIIRGLVKYSEAIEEVNKQIENINFKLARVKELELSISDLKNQLLEDEIGVVDRPTLVRVIENTKKELSRNKEELEQLNSEDLIEQLSCECFKLNRHILQKLTMEKKKTELEMEQAEIESKLSQLKEKYTDSKFLKATTKFDNGDVVKLVNGSTGIITGHNPVTGTYFILVENNIEEPYLACFNGKSTCVSTYELPTTCFELCPSNFNVGNYVEVKVGDGDGDAIVIGEIKSISNKSQKDLSKNDYVILHGLKDADYNGKYAKIVKKADGVLGRYECELPDGSLRSFKIDNMTAVDSYKVLTIGGAEKILIGPTCQLTKIPTSITPYLESGDSVRLIKLNMLKLNGSDGVLQKYDSEKDRWNVSLTVGGEQTVMLIKPDNLELQSITELNVGDSVRIKMGSLEIGVITEIKGANFTVRPRQRYQSGNIEQSNEVVREMLEPLHDIDRALWYYVHPHVPLDRDELTELRRVHPNIRSNKDVRCLFGDSDTVIPYLCERGLAKEVLNKIRSRGLTVDAYLTELTQHVQSFGETRSSGFREVSEFCAQNSGGGYADSSASAGSSSGHPHYQEVPPADADNYTEAGRKPDVNAADDDDLYN